MADRDILEFVQSSKNIIDADYDDENEMNKSSCSHIIRNEECQENSKNKVDADFDGENEANNATPHPPSFEMRNVMKRIYEEMQTHGSPSLEADNKAPIGMAI
ncbi:hypothetical protein TNCV_3592961 [Trichonephila clavipes]|nr:hypothetical protein TNCV_3592961 [Trichonephila clavipes]